MLIRLLSIRILQRDLQILLGAVCSPLLLGTMLRMQSKPATAVVQLCRYKHTLQRSFTQQDIDGFTGLTGDSNPIHKGTKAIVPGLLAASLFPAIIGSAYPGVLYASQELKFRQAIQARSCDDNHPEHSASAQPVNCMDLAGQHFSDSYSRSNSHQSRSDTLANTCSAARRCSSS